MALVEDFAAYALALGVDGTLAGAPVRVIFDAAGLVSSGISAVQPQVQLPTASVPASYQGAALVIPQGSFTVEEHVPDGTGWSTLLLQRA